MGEISGVTPGRHAAKSPEEGPLSDLQEEEEEGEVGCRVRVKLSVMLLTLSFVYVLVGGVVVIAIMGFGAARAQGKVIDNSQTALDIAVNKLRVSTAFQMSLCLAEIPRTMNAALAGLTSTYDPSTTVIESMLKSTIFALQSTSNHQVSAYYVDTSLTTGLSVSPDHWGVNVSWLSLDAAGANASASTSSDGEIWSQVPVAGPMSDQIRYLTTLNNAPQDKHFEMIYLQPTLDDFVIPLVAPCGASPSGCYFYVDSTIAYVASILKAVTPTVSANSRSMLVDYKTDTVLAISTPEYPQMATAANLTFRNVKDPYLAAAVTELTNSTGDSSKWDALGKRVMLLDLVADCSEGCQMYEATGDGDASTYGDGDGDAASSIKGKITTGRDKMFCQAMLAVDELGLRLALVAAMPRSDYYSVLDSIIEESEELREETTVRSVLVAWVLALLSMIGFWFGLRWMFKAQKSLREKMTRAAQRGENVAEIIKEVEGEPSRFTEIASMQRSFVALCENLIQIKDFIQHVGDSEQGDGDDPGDVMLPSDNGATQDPSTDAEDDIDSDVSSEGHPPASPSTPLTTTDKPFSTTTFITETIPVSLKKREVTLMEGNVRNFLGIVRNAEVAELEIIHRAVISAFVSSITQPKAFTDFKGDRVFGYFTMVGHRVESLKSSCNVQNIIAASPLTRGITVTIGLATGVAWCGNLGCDGLKRYNYISGTSVWTHIVERLANKWGIQILADNGVCRDSDTLFVCRATEQVVFAKRGSTQPIILWEVVSRHIQQDANEEWMYVLKQEQDPWTTLNKVIKLYWGGEHTTALELLDSLPPTAPSRPLLMESIKDAIAKRSGPVSPLVVSEIGLSSQVPRMIALLATPMQAPMDERTVGSRSMWTELTTSSHFHDHGSVILSGRARRRQSAVNFPRHTRITATRAEVSPLTHSDGSFPRSATDTSGAFTSESSTLHLAP
eukprot:TRINITY_DN37924_c0_g1_i1.p1 TRINITY_DN37924_c0_g1~~TRINITY_DN37924_c0_g1_i1.p1  ORF type:complete len:957 (+),score=143.28 TRINITY_DN37924_c0_g1_i1:2-2872(+)